MSKTYYNNSEMNEKYTIITMTIFAISATIILLLMIHCFKIYSDTKSNLVNDFLIEIEKIDNKISGKIDKSISVIQLYEERIINMIKNKKDENQILDSEKSIGEILNFSNNQKIDFISSNSLKFDQILLTKLSKKLTNHDYYIIFYENDLLICCNIIIDKKLIGILTYKPLKECFSNLKKTGNVENLDITDNNGYIYKIIGKKSQNYNIEEIEIEHIEKKSKAGAWVSLFTGKNIAFRKIKKYSLLINLQMNKEFVSQRVYINFISEFLKALVVD